RFRGPLHKIYTVLGVWYHATKHALEGWSDSLRLGLEPFGIRVVVIEPGLIETGFGDAASQGLLGRSGKGAYAEVARRVAHSVETSYGHGRGADPEVIADVVGRAISLPRPRTRYAAGKYAKLMIGVRKWLGDRMFDRLIKSQM
ncbi:MAG TPA: short-chain dehydrogenase/reductase, partial [Sphingobium sp.]|uniref:SDR family NAD(P)-dependent oxidoreductase n=1 Tax=Sphingobium sp. TaxID=1912891 RepID=UPI000EDC9214